MDDKENLLIFRCVRCPYTTSTESVFKIQLRYMHKWKNAKIPKPSKASISTADDKTRGAFMCPKCPYSGSTEQGCHVVK